MIGLTPTSGFAYNNKVHAATCQTLFELDASQHLCLGVEPMRTSTIEAVDAFARRLDRTQEEAKAALEQAVDDMKQYYNWSCQSAPEYKVGDKVWLSLQNYSSDCPMKKLDHKWAGPFAVTKVITWPLSTSTSPHGRQTSTLRIYVAPVHGGASPRCCREFPPHSP